VSPPLLSSFFAHPPRSLSLLEPHALPRSSSPRRVHLHPRSHLHFHCPLLLQDEKDLDDRDDYATLERAREEVREEEEDDVPQGRKLQDRSREEAGIGDVWGGEVGLG